MFGSTSKMRDRFSTAMLNVYYLFHKLKSERQIPKKVGFQSGATQPNLGLAEVFGAAEADVDFTPDLLENLKLRVVGHEIGGRYFKQVYRPTTGKAIGTYADGSVAGVENHFGKGRTILIGTFPGAAYFKKPNADARAVFQSFLDGKQRLTVSDSAFQARLHEGSGAAVLASNLIAA